MYMPPNQARFFETVHRADQRIARQRPLIEQASASLGREGHTILAAGVGQLKPFVILAASYHLADLVATGKAAYNVTGIDDRGRFRKGQLLDYRNVDVVWFERGH